MRARSFTSTSSASEVELIGLCDVHLARTVVDIEVPYFEKDDTKHPIDLSDDIAGGRVRVFAKYR